MNKYFQSVTSLEELKKQYRKLSLKLHPDRGGDPKQFILMKNEYDMLFNRFKNKHEQDNEQREYKSTWYEQSNEYTAIIDALINFENIEIELVGTWLYVTGDTRAIKDHLKELKFRWAGKKKCWYWHPEGYVKKSKRTFSMDEIREMHDSKKIKKSSNYKKPPVLPNGKEDK